MQEEHVSGESLDVVADATPDEVRRLRLHFQQWLGAIGVPGAVAGDLVLAVYEALANVVEHAYPAGHPRPVVSLQAQLRDDHVQVTVTDDGCWRAPRASRFRGRGLVVMRLLANVDIAPTPHGTTVRLSARIDQGDQDMGPPQPAVPS